MSKKGINKIVICICLIALSYVAFTVVFRYEDTISYTVWSVEFWDCIFHGNGLSEFYSYAFSNPRGAIHGAPAGSWLTFFPWILWNFPVFLTNMSLSSDVTSQVCVVWSKGLLILCLFLLSLFTYKIVMRITDGNKQFAFCSVILLNGSLEIFDSVAYTGQDEIIYMALFMIAVYYMMLDKKIISTILSLFSVTICPIMIIPVFFLLIVYEKKIIKVFVQCFVCATPTALFEVFYRNDIIYANLKSQNTISTFQMMMNTATFSSAIGQVSIAAVVMIIIAFLCLFNNSEDENKDKKSVVILTSVFVLLCFLMATTFYRGCMYIPFLSIFVCLEPEWFEYKLLLLLSTGIGRFIYFLANPYNISPRYLTGFVAERLSSISEQVINPTSVGYDSGLYIFKAIAFASIILLFTLHFMRKKLNLKPFVKKDTILLVYSCVPIFLVLFFFLKVCL